MVFRLSSVLRVVFFLGFLSFFIATSSASCEVIDVSGELRIDVSSTQLVLLSGSRIIEPQLFILPEPNRLVIDIPSVSAKKDLIVPFANHPFFSKIRLGKHDGFVRIVLDLRAPLEKVPPLQAVVDDSNGKTQGSRVAVSLVTSAHSESTLAPTMLAVPKSLPAPMTDTPIPTRTPTVNVTATPTETEEPTETPTETPTKKATSTPTGTPTPTTTLTHTAVFTETPTRTPTVKVTATPTETEEPTETPTETPTKKATATPTDTVTATQTSTPTPSHTPTVTVTPTDTAEPTETPTKTPTTEATETNTPRAVATLKVDLTPRDSKLKPVPSAEVSDEFQVDLKFSVSDLEVIYPFGDSPIKDVKVKNRSILPLYMTATVFEIQNPGQSDEERRPTSDLLISPKRFQLDKGEERGLRLVLAKHLRGDTESIYRVDLVPDATSFENQSNTKQVAISTGISMLVVAEPKNPTSDFKWTWSDNVLTFKNNGNSNVFLDAGKGCKGTKCAGLPEHRVYANSSWELPVHDFDSIEYLQRVNNGIKKLVIRRD